MNDRFCPNALSSPGRRWPHSSRARWASLTALPPPAQSGPHGDPTRGLGALLPSIGDMAPHTIDRLTIHHAGTQTDVTGPEQIRGWQDWHMNGHGWPDLAYHIIIGVDGRAYEAATLHFAATPALHTTLRVIF